MELVCPAGNLASLKAAVDAGADAVYLGFRDATNARNFEGLNFSERDMHEGIAYAHRRGRRIFLALNTYPQPDGWPTWQAAVDRAAALGVDTLIAADIGVLDYASEKYPQLSLHLSVQGSATSYEALRFYHEQFGVKRAVLPRVLSLAQVQQVIANSPLEIEVFGFGSLCVMVEGRCLLSSYASGKSPNTCGVCSPAASVQWVETPNGLETHSAGCWSTGSARIHRPATLPCARDATRLETTPTTRSRSRPASTPWTCCRNWPGPASPRSSWRGASAAPPTCAR